MTIAGETKIPSRFGELCDELSNYEGDSRKLPITSKTFQEYMDYARTCASYLVLDLESSRREHQYLAALSGGKTYKQNRDLHIPKLEESQKRYLKKLSGDWPEYLKGLTKIYEILTSVKEKCIFPKPVKDNHPINTYQDLINPINTADDFIDFLILGVKFTRFNLGSTITENENLRKKIEEQNV